MYTNTEKSFFKIHLINFTSKCAKTGVQTCFKIDLKNAFFKFFVQIMKIDCLFICNLYWNWNADEKKENAGKMAMTFGYNQSWQKKVM